MQHSFPIPVERLETLASTRGGRVALGGFEYQRAFAIWRLAALAMGHPLGGTEIPVLMRYEWAEDIDEVCSDGRVLLWQCKHGNNWHSPSPLAEVLLGFAPKWIWTSSTLRSRLSFRLVTSDPAFAAHHNQPAALPQRAKIEAAFITSLNQPADKKSDRAKWQDEADSIGHKKLFDSLFDATSVLYMPGVPPGVQQHWDAEQRAVDLLARGRKVTNASLSDEIIGALRPLLDIKPDLFSDAQGFIARSDLQPQWFQPHDVEGRLVPFSVDMGVARLRTMDRVSLQQILAKPAGPPYVARRPDWSDVVRGADRTLLFFERSCTENLEQQVAQALVECTGQSGGLRLVPVLGAPGAGKSTLALRVAAKLVLAQKCLAVDLRHDVSEGDDAKELLDALQTLSDKQLPLLLLLDDPLSLGSAWPWILERLSRTPQRAVVLAASPDVLWERHRFDLKRTIQLLPALVLERPDKAERQALVALYPNADAERLYQNEELLILAMEAAAGESFDAIIDGLWRTLGSGKTWPSVALNRDLPWLVAAFALVCWFSRAQAACPEPLLRAFLAKRDDAGSNAEEHLLGVRQQQGWHIFQFHDFEGRSNFSYLGGSVSAMHARVAQLAWERRPAQGWNVGGAIAQASIVEPASIHNLAMALVSAYEYDADEAKQVSQQLYEAWTSSEAQDQIQTRHLCELVATLMVGRVPLAETLEHELFRRAALNKGDSWLAALQLYYFHAKGKKDPHFPEGLALEQIISSADFSLAPKRASKFLNALKFDTKLSALFSQQLWRAFDGLLPWKLSVSLLTWLLSQYDFSAISLRIESVRAWLVDHPDDTSVRGIFFSAGMHRAGVLQPFDIDVGLAWLDKHDRDRDVRTGLIVVLRDRQDPRLASLLKQTLGQMELTSEFFQPASSALRACVKLPSHEATVIRAWFEWSSATLIAFQKERSAEVLARTALTASRALANNLADNSFVTDAIDVTQLVKCTERLRKSVDDWYSSVGKPRKVR